MALLQECCAELEDVVTNNEQRKRELKAVTQDSPHPYQGVRKLSGRIRIPGADILRIEFDKSCATEYSQDILSIMYGNGRTLAVRSGNDAFDWKNNLRITGDEIRWKFTAQSKGNLWGWRFTVHPETHHCTLDLSYTSDVTVLAVPSLDFAKTLLSMYLSSLF